MFGVAFKDDKIFIEEGEKKELKAIGYTDDCIFASEIEAKTKGRHIEYRILRREWLGLDDYTSERAKELERRLFGNLPDYCPGMYNKEKTAQKMLLCQAPASR